MSLNYSDRIQNAINFSFFKAQDTDKLLLDAIDPDLRRSVDPKNQKTLLKIYQTLFQNTLPENPPSCFQPRKRGNATITPLDRYESFFSLYTTTTLTPNKSREKLLQMCIVLQLGANQTEKILEDIGCQGLYVASLFENCIWYILETKGTLYQLYALYDEALTVASNSTVVPHSIYEQNATSRSRLETVLFLDARDNHLAPGSRLNKTDFLAFVDEVGPYFRHHKNGILEQYIKIRNGIHIPSLYNFFSSCLSDTQSSFLEQHRQLYSGSSHIKYPSRETMILMKLYHQLLIHSMNKQDRFLASPKILNRMLWECSYPQLNVAFPFDHVILEMLEYLPNGKDDQLTMVGKLLPLYQFAFDCKSLQGEYKLPGSVLYEVVNVFDALLHIQYANSSPSFLTSCQLLGRAVRQFTTYNKGILYFIPCRELMILLKITESLSVDKKTPSIEVLNSFLKRIGFRTFSLKQNLSKYESVFDCWIQGLISLPKEDAMLRLYPFLRFIASFKQFKSENSTKAIKASFEDFQSHISFINVHNSGGYTGAPDKKGGVRTLILSKENLLSVVGKIFSATEALFNGFPIHTKLLDCQVAVQTMFSYLEIQLFPCKSSLESAILSIESQNKYDPRELKKPTSKSWVNKFYNLHYGEYTVKFSCTLNGQSWQFSHQVKLSPAEPSLTLHFSPENSQVKVYQEKTETQKVSGVKQSVNILKHLETISLFPPKKCP